MLFVSSSSNLREVARIELSLSTTLFVRELLKLDTIALQRSMKLGVLFAQHVEFTLGIVLLHLTGLELVLSVFNFLFNVCQEKILVKRVDIAN